MDERAFEMAQETEQRMREAGIAARERYQGESLTECEGCGDEIPEARRLAVPGCRLCVDCKARGERR